MTRDRSESPAARPRVLILIVMIVALLAAGVARHLAQAQRYRGASGPAAPRSSLSSMDSFALALLLGGLRGPLVMILWSSSEAQKSEKNLEDFDTKIEWIRLLQPEFDTVHIFQMWNKAYNISVQMANLANKYTTILDAIDYGTEVDKQRPNNVNILYAIGGMYYDKLGSSSEKRYYLRRVREESKPHPARQRAKRNDPGWRRLDLDPILDAQGNILPRYLEPTNPRPADLPPDAEWVNGAELQYLEKYQPFPYGVSALALGYNYFERTAALQRISKQRHAQVSDRVLDSRPAMALRGWGEEEWDRARRIELAVFGKPEPIVLADIELPTASISLSQSVDPTSVEEAIYSYDRAVQLSKDSLDEYQNHLKRYSESDNLNTYQSHLDHMRGITPLLAGDADYLRALTSEAEQRRQHAGSAAEHYREAMHRNQFTALRYFTDDPVLRQLLPAGMTRAELDTLPPEEYAPLLAAVQEAMSRPGAFDAQAEDRGEYAIYAQRAAQRLEQIEQSGLLR